MADCTSPPSNSGRLRDRQRRLAQYVKMLIENDQSVPWYYTTASKIFCWSLLAGYIVLPSTFTSMSRSDVLSNTIESEHVLKAFQNPPLLAIASFLFIVSTAALVYLWWVWRRSYIWTLNRIILPLLANSILGLSTTLINVYTAQNGTWSSTALVGTVAASLCLSVSFVGYIVYDLWLLRPIRQEQAEVVAKSTTTPSGK